MRKMILGFPVAIMLMAASAQAQGAVWSATFTPGDINGYAFGCRNGDDDAECSNKDVLSDDTFTVGEIVYTVTEFYQTSGTNRLYFAGIRTPEDGTSWVDIADELKIGSTSLDIGDAFLSQGQNNTSAWRLRWSGDRGLDDVLGGDSLTDGTSISVTLISGDLPPPPPPPTTPGAPTGLAATANGPSQIDLAWTAPASTGGSAITGYKIEVSPDGSSWSDLVADTGSTDTAYAHMGLDPATTRHYRVSAINAVGTSNASDSDDTTTASTNTAPTGAPTITGTAEVGETLTAVTTGIMDDDGLTSPTYTYQWIRVDGTEADIAAANSSTYTLGDADLGTTLKVKVTFDDDLGHTETLTSAATATVGAVATAPTVSTVDAPTNLLADAEDAAVTLTWEAPEDDGGSAITDYEYRIDQTGEWISIGSTDTTHTVTGLVNGTEYVFETRAVTAAGSSAPSNRVEATPRAAVTLLVANFMNGNNGAFNSRVYLWNPSTSAGQVTVRVFTLPLTTGIARELTGPPLDLGTLEARSALNLKLVEDILIPLEIALPYTDDGGNLMLEFTIQAVDVRGAAQVFSSDFAFGTYPMQEIPSTSSGSPTVLVANFTNGNNGALNSRVYLWNPSATDGHVTVRVFTLPNTGDSMRLQTVPLGILKAFSARNIRIAEDILDFFSGIALPYTDDGGNLMLEFTIEAPDVKGAAQVFSSDFAFGTYPLQEIPSTSSGSPTVLVANFTNGNNGALHSRVYLWNPSASAGEVTVRVFTLPQTGDSSLLGTLDLGSLQAESARNLKLAEDILAPLGIPTPYVTDGGNLTLEFTIQAADARGVAQVFSSDFAFGTYPMQEIPSTSSGSPTVLVANFMNGNDAALNSRVYLWNPSLSAGSVTVRVFTLPLTAGVAQELTTAPLDLGTLGAESARNLKLVEDILTPLGIPTPYVTDGGNLTLEFTIQAADVRGAAQVFSSSFAFGTVPLQVIQ